MSDRRRRFERLWPPVLLILAAVGLATHTVILLACALGALAIGGLAQLWRLAGLRDLAYERRFGETRLFPDETTTLRLRVTNRKLLPLPWLTVAEQFSAGLPPKDGRERHPDLREYVVRQSFTLGPFEQVERELVLQAERRGCYSFPPVVASTGDPFGFYRVETPLGRRDEVLVYPRLLEPDEYVVRAQQPFGEARAALPIWEDPTRLAGARDYVPGDSPRRIHWRASARLGKLQTRLLDPGANLQVLLVLDASTDERPWYGVDHALLERLISVTASIARDALAQRVPVGLLANTLTVNSDQTIRILPGRGPDQLTAILEDLARLIPYFGLPIAQVLERALPRLPFGAAVLLVSALDSAETEAALDAVRRRGHAVLRCDPRETASAADVEAVAWAV